MLVFSIPDSLRLKSKALSAGKCFFPIKRSRDQVVFDPFACKNLAFESI